MATTLLRIATAGSVDDGKSTLIGRLLYDSKAVMEDQLAAVERTSKERGNDYTDLALVTEQLHASVLCPYFVPTGIAESHRNRDPATMARATPSQRASYLMSSKAVASGKLSAAEVAAMVLDAVRTQRFWIFSHPKALGPVGLRAAEMVDSRNPSDPFAERPELGEQLRAALRGG